MEKVITSYVEKDDNILSLYLYGSRVYGTSNEHSDYDFIMVAKDKESTSSFDYLSQFGDVTLYSKQEFMKQIEDHEISVLECLFLEQKNKLKDSYNWNFDLNLQTLRKSCSAKSSNSWVKAKKKLTVTEDFNLYIGQKSAWHAIRILDFGQQIATRGKIENYGNVNELLPGILNCPDWLTLDTNFRQVYNSESTKFKIVAPKEGTTIKKLKI